MIIFIGSLLTCIVTISTMNGTDTMAITGKLERDLGSEYHILVDGEIVVAPENMCFLSNKKGLTK